MKPIYLATAAIVLALPAIPAQAQVVGVTSAVRNDVRLRTPGAPVAKPVQLKQRISIADLVQTGAKSQMQVVLLDRSIFTVGANARLTIDRYVYDPARNNRTMGATVTKGAFRFASGRRTGGSTTINTPTAAIGVRGTIVEGVVGEDAVLIANGERGVGRGVRADPETASLIILRGPGRATTANVLPGVIDVTSGGRTVTVDRSMQAVYIPYPGATPIGPFTISDDGLRLVQAILYPSVAQRLGIDGPIDPDRTYTQAPDFSEPSGGGGSRFPRRAGGYGDPGGGDDGPPGTGTQFPQGSPGGFQPRQPGQNGQGGQQRLPNAAPTPTPTLQEKPVNKQQPMGKVQSPTPTPAPAVNNQQPVGKIPSPTPTPAPPPTPSDNPATVAPTPKPTPTPAPGQKPNNGKSPNDPPPKPPG